eukprot:jgi/Phyca11/13271/fgenesh1_pg.PHYCAscaffold_3_\
MLVPCTLLPMAQNSQDAHIELKETLTFGLLGLVTLPTHLITLRLQTQGCERAYKSIGDAFIRIAKEEDSNDPRKHHGQAAISAGAFGSRSVSWSTGLHLEGF